MAKRTLRRCAYCGNDFVPKHWADPKHCSMKCYSDACRAQWPTYTCLHCGGKFSKPGSESQTRKYCSKTCMSAYKRHNRNSSVACPGCGIEFTPVTWAIGPNGPRAVLPRLPRATCSPECRSAVSSRKLKQYRGAAKGAWKGGLSSSHAGYRGSNWAKIAETVRKRDGYRCQRCGMSQDDHLLKYKCRLPVHHIIPFHNFPTFKQANRKGNLTTLCNDCHMTVEYESPEVQMTFCFYENRSKNRPGLAIGSRHGQAKFTEATVVEIRRRYRNGEMATDLAKEYKVNHSAISHLIDGRTWGHVPGAVPLRGRKEAYQKKREWLKRKAGDLLSVV